MVRRQAIGSTAGMADLIGGRSSCHSRLFGFLLGAAQHIHSIRPQPYQNREQQ